MIEDKKVAVIKATSRCRRLHGYAKLFRVYGRPEELLCEAGGRQGDRALLHFPSPTLYQIDRNGGDREAIVRGLVLLVWLTSSLCATIDTSDESCREYSGVCQVPEARFAGPRRDTQREEANTYLNVRHIWLCSGCVLSICPAR